MNLKNTMIVCLAILAALLAGLFFGEQTGEKVAAAKLEPQVTSLTTERDRQDRYIASLTDAINFFQDSFSYTTTASWYGSFEQGRPTASGERFDMEGMTAAAPASGSAPRRSASPAAPTRVALATTAMRPPSPAASTALRSRFTNTCSRAAARALRVSRV